MKRIISMILAVMLVLSVAAIAVSAESFQGWDERAVSMKDAIAAYEAENSVTIPTKRYYFQLPDGTNGPIGANNSEKAVSWKHEYNEGLCSVYYWFTTTEEQPEAPYPVEEWTGYLCETGDADNIYYADVPAAVSTIIFNNSTNGGKSGDDNPYFGLNRQTANISVSTEPTVKGKSNGVATYANYPNEFFTNFRIDGEGDDSVANYDGMIFILNPDAVKANAFSGAYSVGGSWYYYYGNGCYGYTIDATDMKTSCLNPDHDHSNDTPETQPETSEPETSEPETTEPQPETQPETAPEPETTEPDEEGAYYIIGSMTDWAVSVDYKLFKNDAAEGDEYSFEGLSLTTDSEFKVVYDDGTEDRVWYPDGMGNNYGENGEITADGTYNIYFRPNSDGGDDWFYNCLYVTMPEEPETQPETGEPETQPETGEPETQPETDEPETQPETTAPVENGFYLVGKMNNWTPSEEYKLSLNGAAEVTEYQYEGLALTTTSEFKVVEVDGEDRYWFPDGMGNNYGENGEITTDGTYTIYFRPEGNGGEDWFNGFIYAVCTDAETTEPYTEPTIEPETVPTELPTQPAPVENKIYFDNTTSGWDEESQVYCHIFEYNGSAFFEWQSKKERCDDNGDGTWTYDLDAKGVVLDPEKMYCVMFSNDDEEETYQLFMDTSCMGDTVYCDGTKTENPLDSEKKSDTAYWRNQNKTEYGPVLAISSVGNVIGSACAPDTTPEEMFEDFLTNALDNARKYSGKDDQQLIDDIKAGLSLADSQVVAAIEKTGVETDWKPAAVPEEGTNILGDADGDSRVTIIDATFIQKKLASIPTPTKFFEKEADVNASGKTDILDATWIQRKLASINTPYKIGEPIELS